MIETPRPRSLQELLALWPDVCRLAEDAWTRDFAASIRRQAWAIRWRPSEKQLGIMRRLCDDMLHRRAGEDTQVIE
jgi:hypothetical protein